MTKRARRELIALVCLGAILGVFLINGMLHARTLVRDDLRKGDITNLKKAAEQYNNMFGYYLTPPQGEPACTESSDSSWLFGKDSPLTPTYIDAIPHDVRQSKGYVYRYCVTEVKDGKTLGYYFEAELEVDQPETRAFDEDEKRKFNYRILREDNQVLYRVCGGEEEQCNPI